MVQIVKMMNEHHYRSFSFCSCFHVGNLARLPLTRNVFTYVFTNFDLHWHTKRTGRTLVAVAIDSYL